MFINPDPEWVENLNSVLDDNKLLTLPNGERLSLPSNVRIMFEVDTLKYATLATVSRCGMVWFSEDVVSLEMLFDNYIADLEAIPRDDDDFSSRAMDKSVEVSDSESIKTQSIVAGILRNLFVKDSMVEKVLEFSQSLEHIMDFTRMRAMATLFSLLNKTVRNILIIIHHIWISHCLMRNWRHMWPSGWWFR